MRYKVGDEVILRDDLKESDNIEDRYTNDMEHLKNRAHTIEQVTALGNYVIDDWFVTGDMIDHEKTAELNKKKIYHQDYEPEEADEGDLLYLDAGNRTIVKQFRGGEWGDYIYAEEKTDTVNHPPHYTQGDIETIDIIKILTQGYTGYEGNLVGNVIKYLARANFKGNKVKDIQKSQFYLNKLVEEGEK